MKICSFLWVYYGYPTSCYEGVNVEKMRYECGRLLAKRDNVEPDSVAGVPDSGIAHAIGYSNESSIPFTRPFIKYTPTWPRSFMPTSQAQRNLIARMKLIPVHDLIKDKKLLMIDDSIVRGTQLRETTEFLYQSGAKEVHIRPACPPILYGCKYLNFSRSSSEMDLITRRIIKEREGEVTEEKVKIVQDADAIYREEIAKAGIDTSINQYFAALTNMRSVGVMGDERTYDYAVALRAVCTIDFMTAEAANIPWDVLQKVMSRIINEVKGVNRVFYDLTSKPPGTIEFE